MCKTAQQFRHLKLFQIPANFIHFLHNPKQMMTLEHINYKVSCKRGKWTNQNIVI